MEFNTELHHSIQYHTAASAILSINSENKVNTKPKIIDNQRMNHNRKSMIDNLYSIFMTRNTMP